MAKRKKDEEVPVEPDLSKRIKSYLNNNSKADPTLRVRESERIVDEILKSPEVVAKVLLNVTEPFHFPHFLTLTSHH